MQPSPNLDTMGTSLVRVATDVTLKDMLLAFDEVLEESGVYAYRNWFDGELCQGPDVSRYWFTSTWMWPKKLMPDPDAGLRLTKKGAKVYFYEDKLEQPIKVNGPQSLVDTMTKRAKLITHDVWCVKIEMPRRLIDDKLEDLMDLEDTIEVDSSVAEEAFEESMQQQEQAAPEEEIGLDDEFDIDEEL